MRSRVRRGVHHQPGRGVCFVSRRVEHRHPGLHLREPDRRSVVLRRRLPRRWHPQPLHPLDRVHPVSSRRVHGGGAAFGITVYRIPSASETANQLTFTTGTVDPFVAATIVLNPAPLVGITRASGFPQAQATGSSTSFATWAKVGDLAILCGGTFNNAVDYHPAFRPARYRAGPR